MVGEQRRGQKSIPCNLNELEETLTMCQVQPGNIEVSSIANKVSNGEVWILEGVMNYA